MGATRQRGARSQSASDAVDALRANLRKAAVVRNLVGFYFCSAVSRWQLARVSDERARGGGRR